MTTRDNAARPAERPGDAVRLAGRERRDAIFEASIDRLAEQAALFRDVGLAQLGSHVYAAAEIARARASESGSDDLDARLTEILTALREDVEIRLTRVEAAVRAETSH